MKRPAHYHEYGECTEVVPGVFIVPGDAVYIVDDEGEVVMWNADEWAEDGSAATAMAFAVALAAAKGAAAVRANLASPEGVVLESLLIETFDNVKERVKDAYPNGLCPDCQEEIPANADEGEECENCGHVFYLPKASDDGLDFDAFLNRILDGYYDGENGPAQFKADLLDHYGTGHEEVFSRLYAEHSDLFGRARLEEVLGDFIKEI